LGFSNLFEELWMAIKVFASDLFICDLSPWEVNHITTRDARIAALLSQTLELKFRHDLGLVQE